MSDILTSLMKCPWVAEDAQQERYIFLQNVAHIAPKMHQIAQICTYIFKNRAITLNILI